jgi:ribulose-phosphate 3-epimerase
MIEVIPSLPALSFAELRSKMALVRGAVSTFQVDVCDGMFVTNRSWPMNPGDKAQFERIVRGEEAMPFWEEMDFEADLMMHEPEKILPDLIRAGFMRALIHIEARHDFSACLAEAKDRLELGIALSIGTDIARIGEYLDHIGVVQFMGIAKIGVQGQPFDPRVLDMIRETKARYPGVTIEVDGAVNMQTAPQMVSAGATRLAPGSYVFRVEDPKAAIEALEQLSA